MIRGRVERLEPPEPRPDPPPSAWERVRPARASDEIVRHFRQALFEGRVRAGDSVGSEQQLALQFGVSRTTVRDAMRSLEAGGIVEIRTGSRGGVRIAVGDPNRFADGLAVQLKLVGIQPLDALAAQMGLEWVAADLAATNATPDDLTELERLLTDSADLVKGGSAFTDVAGEFHAAVARASHNWAIQMSLRAIREVLHELHVRNTTAARARRVVQTHRQIYAAIVQGDGSRAGQLMRAHIDATRASADRIEHGARPGA
jgi:GntR family transcriptional regulator, transcriptional repressor for pyruvate dehydrogenase complex